MAISLAAVQQAPKSKTVWLGAAGLAVTYLAGEPSIFEPLVSAEVMERLLHQAAFFISGAVMLVRFFTDGSLEDKAPPEE